MDVGVGGDLQFLFFNLIPPFKISLSLSFLGILLSLVLLVFFYFFSYQTIYSKCLNCLRSFDCPKVSTRDVSQEGARISHIADPLRFRVQDCDTWCYKFLLGFR
jgi:hypothetical protein